MYKNLGKSAAAIADKKFGQNFLKDGTILEKIIEAMPKDGLPIVEIGPGLGDLTRQLIRVGNVRAYEVDKRLCEYLHNEFKEPLSSGNLELVCKDILAHDGSLQDTEYSLVANLPYYIATKIILNALHESRCKRVLVMVQKEVAQKFSAVSGERDFGSLAILAQSVADVQLLFDVPPEAFEPTPKVTSAILYIEKRASLEDKGFEEFLKVATKQPRKTMMKNLSTTYAKTKLLELFEQLGIKPTARSHEIGLSIYHQLYKELKEDRDDESREQRG
ncbi:MAG TPA: 16S rRNA (adenine(1518)-N(6)/adenine(1519)-N(6))-dimethyltransferase RsmA [Nitratifractor sp.]|nr:16S rRNA (adenine(1518)-N(6)/adenine(1519)-N(6))-dimethyltransferase RsmA [Nitratifractor sp.]